MLRAQVGLPLWQAAASASVNLYSMGTIAWFTCRFVDRRVGWDRASRAVAAHAALALPALAAWSAVELVYSRIVAGPDFLEQIANLWGFQLVSGATTYCAAVGIGVTAQILDRQRAQARRQAQLEITARQAELAATRAQLQPHFLMNSLNSIVALIDDEPGEARAMVLRLSGLLQSVFDRFDQPLVPLSVELATIDAYLGIERIRFGERLTYSIDAPAGSEASRVPPFLLQPLVENAVKHGIEPHARAGRIAIRAVRNGRSLVLTIADTGNGVTSNRLPRTGRGVDLTERRLEAMYGGAASVSCRRHDGMFEVTVRIPDDAND